MRRLILAAALCAAAATPAFADNEHQQLVNRQMAVWDANYQGQGYSRILSTGSQTANDDAIQSFGMDLTAGVNYAVAGSCDSDCSDLDVIVYGPNGAKVVEDTATDDQPVVTFQAPQSGRYRLDVRMYVCNTNPCFFAAAVYARTGGGSGGALPVLGPNGVQGSGGSTAASNDYDGQVSGYLDTMEATGARTGQRRLFRSPMLHLAPGAQEDYPVTLSAGKAYTFAGACDNDCSDLDIQVMDSAGSKLLEDTETDSFPVVSFTPSAAGLYRVRVIMYACSSAPCSAQLTVMQK